MATFIEFDDKYVNLDHVQTLRVYDDNHEVQVVFANGDTETFDCYSSNLDVLDHSSPAIPAAPGFELLTYWVHGIMRNLQFLKSWSRCITSQ
jgi:hypothetical protein